MRVVMVNHCHPEMDHVCAVRLRTFAEILAERGHRVVLLSATLAAGSGALSINEQRRRLAGHDWSRPYFLACEPAPAPVLGRLRDGRLPGGLRQVVVAAGYLLTSGVFGDWRRGTEAAAALLAEDFAPDIVWATFGNSDAWNIARGLSRRAGCPWVADLKDNWEHYIPAPFRRLLARRYGDAAHFTALSQGHADLLDKWFGVAASVIYSGFGGPRDIAPPPAATIRMVIAGSIYDGRALGRMIDGVAAWLDQGPPRGPSMGAVEIDYFGNDHRLAEKLLSSLGGRCRITVRPWLEAAELAPIIASATVLLSPRHPPMLYHHKFGDYLASGRPVICLPGETAECVAIAERLEAPLFSCNSAEDVSSAMRAVVAGDYPTLNRTRLAAYGWRRQGVALEGLFEGIIKG